MEKITFDVLEAYLLEHYHPRLEQEGQESTEQSLFMKLVEEIGEVAEVLNQKTGRKFSDKHDLQGELAKELADMIHYIVAIAAINDIKLNDTIIEKDRVAAVKYQHKRNLIDFMKETK
ncbi:MazG nucleotide pyrophosphohydrolase domain-containing protein [Streptococcus henryi]|uniref:MazG nucleotide pyrophosphohydrolase domain-containing protein n=1 Tax=Streptococcus henryi TaxID=439219 RepID=A0A1G6A9J0_9STRE|nr:MazG nucleotide pyrophosphohydrolase domain-containing protein [Streptococcus henryi]SDB04960.1 MazG nucleotide pyrophosphohydrolase domain-containing protein [Streptococcus henryi]